MHPRNPLGRSPAQRPTVGLREIRAQHHGVSRAGAEIGRQKSARLTRLSRPHSSNRAINTSGNSICRLTTYTPTTVSRSQQPSFNGWVNCRTDSTTTSRKNRRCRRGAVKCPQRFRRTHGSRKHTATFVTAAVLVSYAFFLAALVVGRSSTLQICFAPRLREPASPPPFELTVRKQDRQIEVDGLVRMDSTRKARISLWLHLGSLNRSHGV